MSGVYRKEAPLREGQRKFRGDFGGAVPLLFLLEARLNRGLMRATNTFRKYVVLACLNS